MRTQFVMSELAIGLRRNVTMTAAAIVTVMISVTLLGASLMIRGGANRLQTDIVNQIEVSVYFNLPCGVPNAPSNCMTPADQANVAKTLQSLPQVESISFTSQDEACQRFHEEFLDQTDLLKVTNCAELPPSYQVKLKDPKQFPVISSAVSQAPGVGSVANAKHLFDTLFHFFHVLEIVVLVVMVISLVSAILLIYNAMLVAAFSRRRETGIMRLVGASDFYIQAPFILEGTVIGVVGTVLSVLGLGLLRLLIAGSLKKAYLIAPFGVFSNYSHAILPMFLVGILLPAIASFLTLQRHMRV
jgi:cell division transport system permease protein